MEPKNPELIRMDRHLSSGRLKIEALAKRIISDYVRFRFPYGTEDIALTYDWREIEGVYMRSVDTAESTMAVVLKSAEVGAGVKEHSHDQTEFLIVLTGKIQLTIEGVPRVMNEDDTVFIPAGVKHEILFIHPSTLMAKFKPRFFGPNSHSMVDDDESTKDEKPMLTPPDPKHPVRPVPAPVQEVPSQYDTTKPIQPIDPPIPASPEPVTPKEPVHSAWWWGMLILALGGFLTVIGLDPTLLDFLKDGLQAEDFAKLLALLAAVAGYFIKEYGHRQATRPLVSFLPRFLRRSK